MSTGAACLRTAAALGIAVGGLAALASGAARHDVAQHIAVRPGGSAGRAGGAARLSAYSNSHVRLVRLGPGARRVRFWISMPAGLLLLRATFPRGDELSIAAAIPHVWFGVRTWPPSGYVFDQYHHLYYGCQGAGALMTCIVPGACPMGRARWRLTVEKRSGPAGVFRLRFAVVDGPGTI